MGFLRNVIADARPRAVRSSLPDTQAAGSLLPGDPSQAGVPMHLEHDLPGMSVEDTHDISTESAFVGNSRPESEPADGISRQNTVGDDGGVSFKDLLEVKHTGGEEGVMRSAFRRAVPLSGNYPEVEISNSRPDRTGSNKAEETEKPAGNSGRRHVSATGDGDNVNPGKNVLESVSSFSHAAETEPVAYGDTVESVMRKQSSNGRRENGASSMYQFEEAPSGSSSASPPFSSTGPETAVHKTASGSDTQSPDVAFPVSQADNRGRAAADGTLFSKSQPDYGIAGDLLPPGASATNVEAGPVGRSDGTEGKREQAMPDSMDKRLRQTASLPFHDLPEGEVPSVNFSGQNKKPSASLLSADQSKAEPQAEQPSPHITGHPVPAQGKEPPEQSAAQVLKQTAGIVETFTHAMEPKKSLKPESPRVLIGHIDVIVEAPPAQAVISSSDSISRGSLISRRYLRRL